MILKILLLIVGFALLIKGADIFVDGSSSIASHLKISKKIVGLTIVAFGTSAPELAVSINAIANGSGDMVIGNVIGSNIINILLIIGIAAIIFPVKVKNNAIKKEIPILMLISTLTVILFLDVQLDHNTINQISVTDAISMLLFFVVFIEYLLVSIKNDKGIKRIEKPKFKILKSIIFFVLGLCAIIGGSELVVQSAQYIASSLGLSERIISLTVIALGTSLPELITVIVASLKKETDLLMGNIIGSNIFNICIVLALPISLFGGISVSGFTSLDLVMLILSTLILFISSYTNSIITRREGIIMILTFIAYYTYIIFS